MAQGAHDGAMPASSRWKSLQGIRIVKHGAAAAGAPTTAAPAPAPLARRMATPPPAVSADAVGDAPYQAYRSAPFTAAERGEVTVLYGGLPEWTSKGLPTQ